MHDPDGIFLAPIPEEYAEYLIWQAAKPFEELYDIETDPEEIDNLAGKSQYKEVVDQMRQQLYTWMIETRDLGLFDETEMIVRAAAYGGVNYQVGVHCDNFDRILETADLSRLGQAGALIERLEDIDSAVRYWAVTGLMAYQVSDDATIGKLVRRVGDESISVSLAAGDALCRMGLVEEAIPAFERGLANNLLWARLRAGANLSYYNRGILAQMESLLTALRNALQNPFCYGVHEPDVDRLIPPIRRSFIAQRDTIVGEWVLKRVIRRIELAVLRSKEEK